MPKKVARRAKADVLDLKFKNKGFENFDGTN
jgi:hypothetical protein